MTIVKFYDADRKVHRRWRRSRVFNGLCSSSSCCPGRSRAQNCVRLSPPSTIKCATFFRSSTHLPTLRRGEIFPLENHNLQITNICALIFFYFFFRFTLYLRFLYRLYCVGVPEKRNFQYIQRKVEKRLVYIARCRAAGLGFFD